MSAAVGAPYSLEETNTEGSEGSEGEASEGGGSEECEGSERGHVYKAELAGLLSNFEDVGDFAMAAPFPRSTNDPLVFPPGTLAPSVTVAGVGRLAFPLCAEQARVLIDAATPTLDATGTAVQGLWEVGAESVVLQGAWTADPWAGDLDLHALMNVQFGLMCDFPQTRFRKLQICEAGSVFTTGTEAERGRDGDGGAFGSLLVQLPAQHEGGDLVITHMGAARRIHTAAESADTLYYTAFYAGCLHSPQPVTSGLRLVLTFDLLLTPVEGVLIARPTAPVPAEDKTARLMSALQSWIRDTDNPPEKLFYSLGHDYIPVHFSFKELIGSDRQMVNALTALVDPLTQEPLLQIYFAEGWCDEKGPISFDPRVRKVELDLESEYLTVSNTAHPGWELFHLNPNVTYEKEEYNDTTSEHEWYYSPVVVFWPRSWAMQSVR
ncbi:hypothetical protein B484DRAFT_409286 [Ochromonadaceae sp. CCMP2298]|nr:hypothetical protein B484DRAFT_409286 [Ochromonadaceae sp. CCMP2298]